jgi:hypothetical protein
MMAAMGEPVAAEVLDATYRGTMVCDKLPVTSQQTREAIEVTISVAPCATIMWCGCATPRSKPRRAGHGAIDGQKINLQGSWKSGSRQYEATYSGSFVRRSAKLKGTQTWTDGGKTATRACAGAIKRPLQAIPAARQEAGGCVVRS